MTQYSFSYNSDSLNDVFNAVNRKGKMQNRYLSTDYLAKAQEYHEMKKELSEILRKKKSYRTQEETSKVDMLKQQMKDNAQKQKIERTAQMILDARALYPGASLADLYDPLTMPPELLKAHQQNDRAVMAAYGISPKDEAFRNEAACVAMLMQRYLKLT